MFFIFQFQFSKVRKSRIKESKVKGSIVNGQRVNKSPLIGVTRWDNFEIAKKVIEKNKAKMTPPKNIVMVLPNRYERKMKKNGKT